MFNIGSIVVVCANAASLIGIDASRAPGKRQLPRGQTATGLPLAEEAGCRSDAWVDYPMPPDQKRYRIVADQKRGAR